LYAAQRDEHALYLRSGVFMLESNMFLALMGSAPIQALKIPRTDSKPEEDLSASPIREPCHVRIKQVANVPSHWTSAMFGSAVLLILHNAVVLLALSITLRSLTISILTNHKKLPLDKRDHNNYALGRIGMLDVVIVILPVGMQGAVPAAVIARDMIWSFPAIRFCLLVGTGSGLPSELNDVRLGDIAVSAPICSPAMIRSIQEEYFTMDQFSAPSRSTRHHRHCYRPFPHSKSDTISKTRAFGQTFPKSWEHILAHYQHPLTQQGCRACERSELVVRQNRDEHGPEIHYGSIATSNTILKNAIARDHITRELNVICLDSEAAGLMNTLPCLVVKGIADYADTHRNNEWKGFAVLAASAYTKQLLSILSVTTKEAIAAAASLDPDLSNAYRLDLETDNQNNHSNLFLVFRFVGLK
ncbi:hypothetical protein KCU90_g165, partial [Aureobasidium melanogenum]